jgi:hypothetical protein
MKVQRQQQIVASLALFQAAFLLAMRSDYPLLAIIGALVVFSYRMDWGPEIKFRKVWLYGAIVPFSLWWLVLPEKIKMYVNPQQLFQVLAFYLFYLGIIHLISSRKGGEPVFSLLSVCAIFTLSGSSAKDIVFIGNVVLLALILLYGAWAFLNRSDVKDQKDIAPGPYYFKAWFLLLLLIAAIMATREWMKPKMRSMYFKNYQKWSPYSHQMKGFDPVMIMGGYQGEWNGLFDEEVVLRIWPETDEVPEYFAAAYYDVYSGGAWKILPIENILEFTTNYIEHSVFALDTFEETEPGGMVYPETNTFTQMFIPYGSRQVAAKGDTVLVNRAGAIAGLEEEWQEAGYFWYPPNRNYTPAIGSELIIPARIENFIREWALEIFGSEPLAPLNAIKILENYFEREFSYDLEIHLSRNIEPLMQFKELRRGYCEYFAAASTLLLRTQGIPTRLVKGFAGPAPAPGGDYWVFKRKDAHAWIEARIPGQGWVLSDPTPPDYRPRGAAITGYDALKEWMKANGIRTFSLLRDGKWKLLVEAFKGWLDVLFGWVGWLEGALMASPFVLWWLRLRWRRRKQKGDNVFSESEWSLRLLDVEKRLSSFGVYRRFWEPVSDFIDRIETTELESGLKSEALELLRAYQNHRFSLD